MSDEKPSQDFSKNLTPLKGLTERIKTLPPSPRARKERLKQAFREILSAVAVGAGVCLGYLILKQPATRQWLQSVLSRPVPRWFLILLSVPMILPQFYFLWGGFRFKDRNKRQEARMWTLVWALVLLGLYLWSQHINPDVFSNPEYP
jgi:hypothetical protein